MTIGNVQFMFLLAMLAAIAGECAPEKGGRVFWGLATWFYLILGLVFWANEIFTGVWPS